MRVRDVDFLRRRIELRRNAAQVNGTVEVGSRKSGKNRTVVLPAFVIDDVSRTCWDCSARMASRALRRIIRRQL